MEFAQRATGRYRIYAGSLELSAGQGYLSAVVIERKASPAARAADEIYRDLSMSGGHKWLTSAAALQHALAVGARIVNEDAAAATPVHGSHVASRSA